MGTDREGVRGRIGPRPRRVPFDRPRALAARWRHRLRTWEAAVRAAPAVAREGRVRGAVGLVLEAEGPAVPVGELVRVEVAPGQDLLAEAVGFRGGRVVLAPLGPTKGLGAGARVEALGRRLAVPVGRALLGRILDGLGRPMDGRGPLPRLPERPVDAEPPPALERRPIADPLPVGVRAVDGLLTVGRGQRLGIFAGSGVGKSTLLGMMCRHTAADVVVVALVGERGREVRDFLEGDLGPAARARAVVVVATSDQPALVRVQAALTATAVAEHFRDEGADVLLVMDSLTRFAMAWREVGLARGEPPTTRGYTPSVFAALPRLVERAGTGPRGTITGFYTVLVEGDDLSEPVADAVRGLLDGHVVLARDLAARGHYPAIDILASVSRLQPRLVDPEHARAAARVREVLATMRDAQDLVDVGAYRPGTSPAIDHALRWIGPVRRFLAQEPGERSAWEATRAALVGLCVPEQEGA
jgi:flagellum-specific ATP synthase